MAVEWVEQTDNRTGPIGEALVAGTLHVGAGGPAVFFQGWDRGFAWKTTGALCTMPLYLVANRPELRTLKDFGPGDTIALPAPGGNQHVFLQMAAAQELGDAHALDHLVVGMSHADAQAALLAGRVAAHFGSPPFQYDELAQGGPDFGVVVDTYTVMGGPHTFTMTWAMEDWATGNPGLFAVFVAALQEATAFIGDDPAAAARLYVEGEPSRLSPDEIQRQLRGEGIAFTTTPRGFLPYAAFCGNSGPSSRSRRPGRRTRSPTCTGSTAADDRGAGRARSSATAGLRTALADALGHRGAACRSPAARRVEDEATRRRRAGRNR